MACLLVCHHNHDYCLQIQNILYCGKPRSFLWLINFFCWGWMKCRQFSVSLSHSDDWHAVCVSGWTAADALSKWIDCCLCLRAEADTFDKWVLLCACLCVSMLVCVLVLLIRNQYTQRQHWPNALKVGERKKR